MAATYGIECLLLYLQHGRLSQGLPGVHTIAYMRAKHRGCRCCRPLSQTPDSFKDAVEKGLESTLRSPDCVRRKLLTCMGHLLATEGMKPDPNKIYAILNTKNPTNVAGVRRTAGRVSYQSTFLSNPAELCKLLRQLTQEALHGLDWCL